jgi:hypothetical protein
MPSADPELTPGTVVPCTGVATGPEAEAAVAPDSAPDASPAAAASNVTRRISHSCQLRATFRPLDLARLRMCLCCVVSPRSMLQVLAASVISLCIFIGHASGCALHSLLGPVGILIVPVVLEPSERCSSRCFIRAPAPVVSGEGLLSPGAQLHYVCRPSVVLLFPVTPAAAGLGVLSQQVVQ